jgi:hypothetical protein
MVRQKKVSNQFDTKEKLMNFLQTEKNVYTEFILGKIGREINYLSDDFYEKHHIIPKHMGGSNKAFNLIVLTKEEHFEAHALLAEVYKSINDKLVLQFRTKAITKKKPMNKDPIQEIQSFSPVSVSSVKSNLTETTTMSDNSVIQNVPLLPAKQALFQRISKSGLEHGFIFIGIISFESVDKSSVEFFCIKHKVFIVRSWSLWSRCFSQKNESKRPPCCNAAQKNISLNLAKQPSVTLHSQFTNIPKGVEFTLEEQKEILNTLANPQKKCVIARKNSGVPEPVLVKIKSPAMKLLVIFLKRKDSYFV